MLIADAEGEMELAKEKVILPMLSNTNAAQNQDWIIWVLVGAAGLAVIAAAAIFFMKKSAKKKAE